MAAEALRRGEEVSGRRCAEALRKASGRRGAEKKVDGEIDAEKKGMLAT